MSQNLDLDKMLVLDALSSGLNISIAELLSILGLQAPISNLLLEPIIRPQQLTITTTLLSVPSAHPQHRAERNPMTPEAEEADKTFRTFQIVFWVALGLATLIAISAVWTKVHMAAQKGRKKFEATTKPQSDVERWHMRRQREREASTQLGQVDDQTPGA
ncbi:hypothetical protein G6011_06563 [Alternaria panax]|uniref:Uncharacterized protein n=1 Tax=Alternaria panax TaxID=48097 RepID=A0AAD4FHX7_9PLEO|nr:hypothetical protein G6011_06563 [Alternaria panax]